MKIKTFGLKFSDVEIELMETSRRGFARGVVGLPFVAGQVLGQIHGKRIPVSGVYRKGLEPFDEMMTGFLREFDVPGAAIAVSRHGKVVYDRGFGYANVEQRRAVVPGNLFRIASISKPITAVAILQLASRKKIDLDKPVLSYMKLSPFLVEGAQVDRRWEAITVRQCLQHTGGWNRDKSYDPAFRVKAISEEMKANLPLGPQMIVRYMMGKPLDFDPGQQYAYSNLGYLVLGRIIEAVTGLRYEQYVKRNVFGPIGVQSPAIGHALLSRLQPREVRYYLPTPVEAPGLFPPFAGRNVPLQYGGLNIEGFEAHGGWISTAADLVRFANAFNQPERSRLLSADWIETMWAPPAAPVSRGEDGAVSDVYYGCGWSVRKGDDQDGKLSTWHTGSIDGSETILVRRWDGVNWAVLLNTRKIVDGRPLLDYLDARVHHAADRVKDWPRA